MTKPTQPEAPAKRTYAPVDLINMLEPLWAVLYQTETRNVWETFTGPDAEGAARVHAAATALRTGKLVAVLPPQVAVYGPPEPVVPVASQVPLPFAAKEAVL